MSTLLSFVAGLRQAAPADMAPVFERALVVRAADVAALVSQRRPADGLIGPVPTLAPYAHPLLICWTDHCLPAGRPDDGLGAAAVLLESLDLWSCDAGARMEWLSRARGLDDEILAAAATNVAAGATVRWLRRARVYLTDEDGVARAAWQITLAVAADGTLARPEIDEGPIGREQALHRSMTAGMQGSVQAAMRLYTRIGFWTEALAQCANVRLVPHGRDGAVPATYDLAVDGWSPGIARGRFARATAGGLLWLRSGPSVSGERAESLPATLPDALDIMSSL